MFWAISAGVLLLATALALLPVLRRKSPWQPVALALVFAVPAATLWLYSQVGTPQAIGLKAATPPKPASAAPHETDSTDMAAMVESLRGRLSERPEDLQGWILLARTLKTMQRFPEALEALQTAERIAPDNPLVQVDLVETRLFLTPDGRFTDDMVLTLENALKADPTLQKAYWLLGIAAAQNGDDARAVEYWQTLLGMLEPDSTVAQTLQAQIEQVRKQSGQQPVETKKAATGTEIAVRITGSPELPADFPPGSVLYVIIRAAGGAGGPPLGVRRVDGPSLPLEISIDDADSMMSQRPISSQDKLQLQARISRTGSPTPSSGDWQSEPVTVDRASGASAELVISQQVE